MKKLWARLLSGVLAAGCLLSSVGCGKNGDSSLQTSGSEQTSGNGQEQTERYEIVNGGFESADLSGWTVEYGNAFDDDSVSSKKTFEFANDEKHNQLSVNATGNWYLSGKGFDGRRSFARTGAIRSTNFTLGGDGSIRMKLAGGALTQGKGTEAAYKPQERLCYVGVYRASDDRMIARQTNEYFLEHTESYVPSAKYAAGVYNTDNFYEYTLDLSEYLGEELYLRIVDNDESVYYGYLSVDDIRTNSDSDEQTEGAFFTKVHEYVDEAEAESEYEIVNGGFETGSLAGWTIAEGDAFSNDGVNPESVWWNENIPYSRDGEYHYGFYRPAATGRMRSSAFVLGGSGYISYKLGGCADNGKTYLRFMMKTENGDKEIARFSNFKYLNYQFPYVANGMRLLNMVQYYADFSAYLNETLYIEVVDENDSPDDLGCITLDSVKTYWKEKPVWYYGESYEAKIDNDVEIESPYQVRNGTFETGDLTGWIPSWTAEEDKIGAVSDASGWWKENLPYNKRGRYLFTGISDEGKTGTLTSSEFEIGGANMMTFLLGGCGNPALCYLSVVDAETDEELARYSNGYFHDLGIGLINKGSNLANMVWYRADLSEFSGRKVRLRLVDNATADWGLICADSFITYYATAEATPSETYLARNILPKGVTGENDEYQVTNGDFETGDLTGWTLEKTSGDGEILGVAHGEVWWNEWYSFNKAGEYFLSGWAGKEEATGTLTSSAFTVGGSGWVTFRLGGGKNTDLCYVEFIDADTGETLAKFGNTSFRDMGKRYYYNGQPIDLGKDGVYMANMQLYKADLSEWTGRRVRIRLVDNATADWGLLFADDFITYYSSESELPEGAEQAQNLNAK